MFSNYEIIAAELSLSTARDGEVLQTYLNKHAEASLRCLMMALMAREPVTISKQLRLLAMHKSYFYSWTLI